MRALLVLGCAIALFAPVAQAFSGTELTITYFEGPASSAEPIRWTLRCDPTGGTHPRRVTVCRELARMGWAAFKPVPSDRPCTEVYGGPQTAIVAGHVGARRVWARLTRVDGCQIERWGRVRGLLPPGGAT